jgi:tetratricopeptide (TPR) repeat protein
MEAKENSDQVLTSSEEITLPTYRLLGENRNPVFHSQYGVAHIYPYTLQDEIASVPTDVVYKALILENKYLRVTLLPELGGRVFSLYDKVSKREVFYKNTTVKFSPLAIRGAFFSGGLEFSFPVAHAPTTAENVNWDFQHHDDGSAAIIIGGQEHMSGMRWTIKLSLFPSRCALAQDVQLYNPNPIPGRYHYWTNASTDSDAQTEFIYPLQRVRSYEFAGTASWPIARLDPILSKPGLPGMEGVPMWPAERLHDPINFRWEKHMLAQVSIFGRDVTWDYFGAWQHSSNTGYAHFARYQDVSGMKLWSWGQSEVGIVNQTALMDDGSLYAETQCGAMETQLDFDFLLPGELNTWREWWLPLRGMNGMTCASKDLGARLHLALGDEDGTVKLTLGVCPATAVPSAEINLSVLGETLFQEIADISPEQPWLEEITVQAQTLSANPLTLSVRDSQGRPLLDYTHNPEPYSAEFSEEVIPTPPKTAEDFYQIGLKHENFDNRAEALKSYWQAIRTSEEHGPSHLQLGKMLLRSADFKGASHHLRWAADLGLAAALYYLGLVSWYQGDFPVAEDYYRFVPQDEPLWSSAQRGLAAIAFKHQDWKPALQLLKKSDHDSINNKIMQGIASLLIGERETAQGLFEGLLAHDPLNLVALNELAALDSLGEHDFGEKLHRLLSDDRQYYLDLACAYLDLGLDDTALAILEGAAGTWDHPCLNYLAAYLQEEKAEAAALRARAREADPDFVFPSRIWEVIALQEAINQDNRDVKAKYYLASFYYARQRPQEAIAHWEAALRGMDEYDVLHRNLGLAYWQQENDLLKATNHFERGLQLNPDNQDLYLHLDDLYRLQGEHNKRGELLSKMDVLDPIREDLRKRKISMMVDLDQYEKALEIIAGEQFVPLEMDQSFHLVYVRALLKRAAAHLDDGQIEAAISDYQQALEFPVNQGVGRPLTMGNAEILFRLGCAYELLGDYRQAIRAWQEAAREHHAFGDKLFPYLQKSLDKLGRYSELGFEG